MTSEYAQAISVANHYFLLADNIISDFENFFADDVILVWFGQMIKGKKNVINFISSDNIKTFHSFSNILPISGITCEDEQPNE